MRWASGDFELIIGTNYACSLTVGAIRTTFITLGKNDYQQPKISRHTESPAYFDVSLLAMHTSTTRLSVKTAGGHCSQPSRGGLCCENVDKDKRPRSMPLGLFSCAGIEEHVKRHARHRTDSTPVHLICSAVIL